MTAPHANSPEGASPKPHPWTMPQALEALGARLGTIKLWGALRLLQAAAASRFRLGHGPTPSSEGLRLEQGLVLGHASQEVAALRNPEAPNDGNTLSGQRAARTNRVVVTQNAVGLLGPNGPMPLAWTQYVLRLPDQQASRARRSFLAFLNLLQRRQLSFLFRAWSDALAITALDAPGGRLEGHPVSDRLRAIAGVAQGSLAESDSLPQAFKAAFASAFARRVRSPLILQSMLRSFLDAPVRIDEFCARWLDIPRAQQTALGTQFALLGQEAVAGERTWDCSTMFEVVVGPLDLDRYESLLPGTLALRQVRDLVALYCGPEWSWRLRLVLLPDAVPPCQLGSAVVALGWTGWIGERAGRGDADDLVLDLMPPLANACP